MFETFVVISTRVNGYVRYSSLFQPGKIKYFSINAFLLKINDSIAFDAYVGPITLDFATSWSKKRRRPRFSINCQKMWHLTTLNIESWCHFFHFSRSLCTNCKIKPWRRWKNPLEFPILPTINFSLETFSDPFCYPTENMRRRSKWTNFTWKTCTWTSSSE